MDLVTHNAGDGKVLVSMYGEVNMKMILIIGHHLFQPMEQQQLVEEMN